MIVATDVMRMGRSRMRPASSTAETVSSPRAFSWLVYSTSRIEFLLTKPISKIMPIPLSRWTVAPDRCRIAASFSVASAPVMASGTASSTVQGCTSDSNCDASTMNTTSSATPNAKYNAPELSRNSRDSPARAVVVPGGNTWRHPIERVEGFALCQPRQERRGQGEGRHAIEVVDLARAHAFLDVGQGVELDQLPALAAQVDPPHVARRGAILGIELHHHVVQLVVARERADPASAEERLERRRDVAYRNAQIFGTIALDSDPH